MALVGFQRLPLSLNQLSLAAVLKCGQSFRWTIFSLLECESPPANHEVPSHEYRLCLKDRVVCLRQSTDTLYYRSVLPNPQLTPTEHAAREAETLLWLQDYFQLDVDLQALYKDWALRDKVFANVQDRFKGVRMLRQDPWENLVSFICSSNNNISRITKMVQNVCHNYSTPLLSLSDPSNPGETHSYHPFPPPSALAEPAVSAKLRTLGFGYRADFIQKTAKMLVDTHGISPLSSDLREPSEIWLQSLRSIETPKAREELLKFVGVGRKVADCILLMSLDKRQVIPVDTHVHQIAVKHYGMKGSSKTSITPKLYDDINNKLQPLWGDYAGWAHSVLFTADLRSFSEYGLESPTKQSASPTPRKRIKTLVDDLLPMPLPVPPPPLLKRQAEPMEIEPSTLAERIKRRRRGGRTGSSSPTKGED